jgi:hypothetical protein
MKNIKTIIQLLVLLSLIGCKEQLEMSVETTFYTQDSLYKITFEKPLEMDTFYDWKHQDDNPCDDLHKYRFSKRHFPVQKETGFFLNSAVDSTYRLTIGHVENFFCKATDNSNYLSNNEEYMRKLKTKNQIDSGGEEMEIFKVDNESPIDGKESILYSYKIYEKYRNGYKTNYIKAFAKVDSNMFFVTAECRAADCNNFINRVEKSIQTIQIRKK